jgi:hypothetical protein
MNFYKYRTRDERSQHLPSEVEHLKYNNQNGDGEELCIYAYYWYIRKSLNQDYSLFIISLNLQIL